MLTYQDFEKTTDKAAFISQLITEHKFSNMYRTAILADKYDKQKNETIENYVRVIYTMAGIPIEDFTASNNKLPSNFFHRLNTQRCVYLVGNGVSFSDHKEEKMREDGVAVTIDTTKERLGVKFDTDLKTTVYNALIHGICFGYWNGKKLFPFSVLNFAPLWDEESGALRAGVRFWKLAPEKPTVATLYTEEGYETYESKDDKDSYNFEITKELQPYKITISSTEVGGDEIAGFENYSSLPIKPLWGSNLKQSTLIGMQQKIDSFDLIRSGFANDLTDCAQIFWILENYGGMSDKDLAVFRDRLKINHIATADTSNGGKVTPYTQEIPYQARKMYLDDIRAGIYEDFGGLDVHTIAAGATNDHIDAAYQPLDEEADDLEYQVCEFIQQILALEGIEDTPIFKRNRVSNEKERTDMVLSAADYLDDETILQKLPFVTVDEIVSILAKKDEASEDRFENDEPLDISVEASEIEGSVLEEYGADVENMLNGLLEELK